MQLSKEGLRFDQWVTFDTFPEPGSYGFDPERQEWYCTDPIYGMVGRLTKHEVVEHPDGKITVQPSILLTLQHGQEIKQFHGYLTNGVWTWDGDE